MMDAICAGILVADTFSSPIDSLPRAGELKLTQGFLQAAGGCAMNVAADLRRLGRTATLAGMVGNDMLGDFVVREAERQGIHPTGVLRSARSHTSQTVIIPVEGEDRRYLHSTGANADYSLAQLHRGLLEGAHVLYVGGYLAMPGFTAGDLADLFRCARSLGLVTVLDVVVPAGASVSPAAIAPVLPHTSFFLPNEDEACAIAGHAEALADLAPACTVVVTRGRSGCSAWHAGARIETPAYAMHSVDESGAGDAFAAGLIAGILENWPLERTLRFASAVGASCTRALGCTAGVFTMEEALAFLEAQCR